MSTLTLERTIHSPGFFGVWDWSEEDWETPLIFPMPKGETHILLQKYSFGFNSTEKREIPDAVIFRARFDEPTSVMIKAVKSQGERSTKFAEELFALFDNTMRRTECALRTTAGLKELYWQHHETVSSFFGDSLQAVTWQYQGQSGVFAPKIKSTRRRLSDTFRRKNLIDRSMWSKLQLSINEDTPPTDAILELLRIRSRVVFRERALPLIEAAIITERTVREFVLWKLQDQGMNKKRVKELKNDLTFSLNSNVFLPLCLNKTEIRKMQKHIEGVNKLRKIRNDVAHSNIGYDDVTYEDGKAAVESAIALVQFVERKLPRT